jgi:trans-aconitate methyltransferase
MLGRIVGSRNPSFTIIDKCPAPLAHIKEFAALKGVPCNTLHADILELDGREEWDFIFVHYTHAFVEPSRHKDFFGALARSLAPGGTLACITKANRNSDALANRDFDSTWFTQARQAIRKSELRSSWEGAELDEMLRAYVSAAATRRQSFLTLEDLVEGQDATGLRVSVKNLMTVDKKKSTENVLSYASYASSPVILATRIAS